MSKRAALLLIAALTVSTLLMVKAAPTSASTTPSVPEFTVKFVDRSYDVPPVYGIDQYTGKNVTVKEGYVVNGKNLVFTIKNQPFTSYNDSSDNTIGLYYNFRYKGHYGYQWSYYPFGADERTVLVYNGQPWGSGDLSPKYPALNADETVISIATSILNIRDALVGSQVDCQVQAMIGHVDIEVTGLLAGDYYTFVGTTSEWSNTQTITISESQTTTSSPETPEQINTILGLVTVTLIIGAALGLLFYLKKRKS